VRPIGRGAAQGRFPLHHREGTVHRDINRPGQSHIHFLRSPHAHAKIRAVDTKAAAAMPGVLAVHRRRPRRRQDRRPHLRLDDPFQGRIAHEDAPHPAIARDKACFVGEPVAVVIAETLEAARDAADKVKVDYEVLEAVVDPAKAQARNAPQIHVIAPANTIYQWHLGDAKAVDQAFKSAAHVTKLEIVNNRLVPNAMEPRAAIGDYDSGTSSFTLWNTTQNPHVARLVIARSSACAGAQAARDRARCRRRLGSKIFVYPKRWCACGLRRRSVARSNGCRSAARPFWPTPMGAITSPMRRWRSMPTAGSPPSA
jgi:carbon-monoxide dehydrogenase large subunit